MVKRLAASNALMQWSAPQQIINAVNPPRQTNCYGVRELCELRVLLTNRPVATASRYRIGAYPITAARVDGTGFSDRWHGPDHPLITVEETGEIGRSCGGSGRSGDTDRCDAADVTALILERKTLRRARIGAVRLALTFGSPAIACDSGHWVEEVSSNGAIVVLGDDSVWSIAFGDQSDTSLWLPTTDITVCDDKLINTEDGEIAEARRLR
jgi:hypothetical protein